MILGVIELTQFRFENHAIEYKNVLTLSWLLAHSKSFFSLNFASLEPEFLQDESKFHLLLTKQKSNCLVILNYLKLQFKHCSLVKKNNFCRGFHLAQKRPSAFGLGPFLRPWEIFPYTDLLTGK